MVPWLRRRRLSVPSLAFAGWARRFCRARDPGTTVAQSVSGGVRRRDVAREYGARTAKESVPHGLHPLELIPRWGGQRPLSDCSCHSTAASERVPSDPLRTFCPTTNPAEQGRLSLANLRARALGNHKSFDERLGTEERHSGVSVACPSWKTLGIAREAQRTFPGPVTPRSGKR